MIDIKTTLTINELRDIVNKLHVEGSNLTIDDLLITVANAAAKRAVLDLMELDDGIDEEY